MIGISPYLLVASWIAAVSSTLPRSTMAIAAATVDACDDFECMAELVAIARYESGFAVGARGKRGEIGPWQIDPAHLPAGPKTSLQEQARKAAALVAQSKAACDRNPALDALALYTSGDCRYGRRESRSRMRLAASILGSVIE